MSKKIEAKLAKVQEDYEAKLKKIEDSYEAKLSATEKKISSLEKENQKAKLSAAQDKAERIWATQLAESDVHPKIAKKIRKNVPYLDFMKDGILDHVQFVKAVQEEIEGWEEFNVVQGTGFGGKSAADQDKFSRTEFDDCAEDLLKLAGQKTA